MSDAQWLSCENANFVGLVYDLAAPIHLGRHSYEELVKIAPDRAYVVDVDARTTRLVDRFESLNRVYLMLSVTEFPIKTSTNPISRYEWIRITLDVLLTRLNSIRDSSLLLVSDVFELYIKPREVNLQKILNSPKVPSDPFNKILTDIANTGKDFRDERDRHAHRSEERSFGPDTPMYKVAALFESLGSEGNLRDRSGNPTSLNELHQKIVEQIHIEFTTTAKDLEIHIMALFDALYPHFTHTWEDKRKSSQLG